MSKIIQRDAAELAGTPPVVRKLETAFVWFYPAVLSYFLWRAFPAIASWPLLVPLAVIGGMLVADFVSGSFHWLFDTWGSPNTYIVGRMWIRTFREHHVDQKAITRHDFIETNGSNIFAGFVAGAPGLLADDPASSKTTAFFVVVSVSASIFTAMTSQIHKWAHMDEAPRLIVWLQKARILLSPDHHAIHHAAPFHTHYCITTGWLNPVLAQTRFFTVLERIITSVTGALPRRDDIGEHAALETLDGPLDLADRDGDVVLASTRERVVNKDLT